MTASRLRARRLAGSTDVGCRTFERRSMTAWMSWIVRRVAVHRMTWTVLAIAALIGMVAVPSASAQDRDCGDFSDQAAAQAYYLSLGGPTYDPDRLDAD